MAGITIRMKAQKRTELADVHAKIHYIEGVELVSKVENTFNGVTSWLLAYEKYFTRTGSFAGLTVLLTECEQEQFADLVAFGGGSGIVNYSFGANRKLAEDCVKALLECGFEVTGLDPEEGKKGLLERFFK